jgi:magnesium-transporting ATPase (P-type)
MDPQQYTVFLHLEQYCQALFAVVVVGIGNNELLLLSPGTRGPSRRGWRPSGSWYVITLSPELSVVFFIVLFVWAIYYETKKP